MKGIADIALIGLLSLTIAGAMLATGAVRTDRVANATARPVFSSNMSILNLDTGEHIPIDSDPRAVKNFVQRDGQKVFVSSSNKTVLSQIRKENIIDPEVMATQKTVKMEYDWESGERVVVPYNYDSDEIRHISQNEDVIRAIQERPTVDRKEYSLLNVQRGEHIRLDSDDEIIESFQRSAKERDEDIIIVRSTDSETLDLISHSYDVRKKVETLDSEHFERGVVYEDSVSGESFFTGPKELLTSERLISKEKLSPELESSLRPIEAVSEVRERELAQSVDRGLNLSSRIENAVRILIWIGAIIALIFILYKFAFPFVVSYISSRGEQVRHTKEVSKKKERGKTVAKEKGKRMGAQALENFLLAKPLDTLVEVGSGQSVTVAFSNIGKKELKNVEVTSSIESDYLGDIAPGEEKTASVEISSVSKRDSSTKLSVNFSPIKVGGRTFEKHKFTIPIKVVKLSDEDEKSEEEEEEKAEEKKEEKKEENEKGEENCAFHPEKEAVARCVDCSKLLCSDCAEEHEGKIYCPDCSP